MTIIVYIVEVFKIKRSLRNKLNNSLRNQIINYILMERIINKTGKEQTRGIEILLG